MSPEPSRSLATRPRVVMLVANPCIHDARVIREAETLAAAGYEVRVLCKLTRNVEAPLLETRNGVVYERFGTPRPPAGPAATVAIRASTAPVAAVTIWAEPPVSAIAASLRPTMAPPPRPTPARVALASGPPRVATLRPSSPPEDVHPTSASAGAADDDAAPPADPEDVAADETEERRSLLSPVKRTFRALRRTLRRGWRATRRGARRTWRLLKRWLRQAWRAARRWLRQAWRAARRWLRQAWRAARRWGRQHLRPDRIAARWLAPTRRYRQLAAATVDRLVELQPDVIHAHDLDTLRAAYEGARRTGAKLVYDAHEIETARMPPRPWHYRLQVHLCERSYIPKIDGFITVSDGVLGHYAARHALPRPTVLFNTPDFAPDDRATSDVRSDCGLPPEVWLGVYVGAVGPGRGIETLLAGLAQAPETHLAMVGARRPDWDERIGELARSAGIEDRLHRLPPVPARHVVSYIASASFGIYTMQDTCLNHRYALPNKIFEMTFAGLPIVGPDLADIRAYLAATGVGFAVDPDDPAAIAAGIRRMAREFVRYRPPPERLREIARTYGWPAQAAKLRTLYRDLLGPGRTPRRALQEAA